MPTKRTKRTRRWDPGLPDWALAVLRDEPVGGEHDFEAFLLRADDERLRTCWAKGREQVLQHWIQTRPGTRPLCWWAFDAPRWDDRWPDCFWHGTLPAPRERVGGVGTPAHECLAVVPHLPKGMPVYWLTRRDVEIYSAMAASDAALDEPAGVLVMRPFPHAAYDADDPPRFESEARYLQRHDLLIEDEVWAIPDEGWLPEVAPASYLRRSPHTEGSG